MDQTILTNSKQYLTHLVSVGIAWYQHYIKYHHQYDSSIIIVLSQYSSDSFISVWYNHSTDSGYFQKTFNGDFQV